MHTDAASGGAPDAAHQGGILEAPAEKSFDRMLRLAETALCTPIVLMSFGGSSSMAPIKQTARSRDRSEINVAL